MDTEEAYLQALIALHEGLDRQGPGDAAFSQRIMDEIRPLLPAHPRIADLGCGTGAVSVWLAAHFQSKVKAVDLCPPFVDALRQRCKQIPHGHLIEPLAADMGQLDWPEKSLDLIWSEGAAYNLGFENALRLWRPLLSDQGLAVVSEMSWFVEPSQAAPAARAYWLQAYPSMATEAENRLHAQRHGWRVLDTRRLPAPMWWDSYYTPLLEKMARTPAEGAMAQVLQDTQQEIDLVQRHSGDYGYTFYLLQAA
jgi:SAM-dependent methyltransferase